MSMEEKHSEFYIQHFISSLELLTQEVKITFTQEDKATQDPSTQQSSTNSEGKDSPPARDIESRKRLDSLSVTNMFTKNGYEEARTIKLEDEYTRYLELLTEEAKDLDPGKSGIRYKLQYKHTHIIRDLWISLTLSLLSGEFLLCDDYSKDLNKIIRQIEGSHNRELNYFHPILFPAYKICLRLREVCELTKLQITENSETKNQSVFVLTDELTGLIAYHQQASLLGISTDHIQLFEKLMMHIVDMTYIDISGTMRRKDIKLLQDLYEYIISPAPKELLLSFRGTSSFKMGENNKHVEASDVCNAVMAKASLLLAQSFYKPQGADKDPKKLFINEEEVPECYHNTKHGVFLYRGKTYIHQETNLTQPWPTEKAYSLYTLWTEGSLNKIKLLTSTSEDDFSRWGGKGGEDIATYNKFLEGEEGKSYPVVMNLRELFDYARDIEQKCEEREVEKDNNKRKEILEKLIPLVNNLRDKLKDIIDYTSKNRAYIPRGIRLSKINDCLFTVKGKSDIEVFIASYGTPPIFIDILEEVVYPRLNAAYKKGSLVIASEIAEVLKETETVKGRTAEFLKKTTAEFLEETNKVAEEIKKKDSQYISILGIFAAMIVFATTTTTIFEEADTLHELLSVLLAGYGLTALLLYFFHPKEEHKKVLLCTIVTAIVLSLIFAIFKFNVSVSLDFNNLIQLILKSLGKGG